MTTSPKRAGHLTGLTLLLRCNLRFDRLPILLWTLLVVGLTAIIGLSFQDLYPAAADRALLKLTMSSPASLALTGPAHYLTDYTYGSILSHQLLGMTALAVAFMSVQLVVRRTRTEEETGRAELVRAAQVGRHAPLGAALAETALVNLVIGALLALFLPLLAVPTLTFTGALVYGAAHAAAGLTFAGIAALAAQVFSSARACFGLGVAAAGLAYTVRALGDAAHSGASWASPFGWAQATFPFLENRPWPLALNLALAVACAACAFSLTERRNLGGALRQPRPGPPQASAHLTTPLGFALRLQRGSLIGFTLGILALGVTYGSFFREVETTIENLSILKDALGSMGADSLIDAFLTMITSILALVAACYAVSAVLRIRSEELSGRSEPLLLSRTRWAGSHLTLAVGFGGIILLLGALALGGAAALTIETPALFGKTLAACAAYLPAIALIAALTLALVGWVPRAAPLAWAVITYAGFLSYLGPLLRLPQWMSWFSPFGHTPHLPIDPVNWVKLAVVTLVAAGLAAVGMAGYHRRDLASK